MLGERRFMPLFDVIKKNPFKCDLDHLLERINPYVIKLWNFISFTSFLESASHTKAATAIPALLCTIAALKEKKNMHWAFYTWQTFLNWENYGQEWYSLRSYDSWCHLMPSWRMPCTVMTTWFHIVFTTTSVLYLYSSSTVTIQSLFDTTAHARLAPVP